MANSHEHFLLGLGALELSPTSPGQPVELPVECDQDLKVFLEAPTGEIWRLLVTSAPTATQALETTQTATPTLPFGGDATLMNRDSRTWETSFSPAEWGFTSNIQTYQGAEGATTIDAPLWALLTTGSVQDRDLYKDANSVHYYPTRNESLEGFTLYYVYPTGACYKLTKCVVATADINIDLAGVATVAWSGVAASLTRERVGMYYRTDIENYAEVVAEQAAHTSFIANKLSLLDVTEGISLFPITTAQLTISKTVSPVIFDTLGAPSKPIGFSSGTWQVAGTASAYIGQSRFSSGDSNALVKNLLRGEKTSLSYAKLDIGGTQPYTNRMSILLGKTTLTAESLNLTEASQVSLAFSSYPDTSTLPSLSGNQASAIADLSSQPTIYRSGVAQTTQDSYTSSPVLYGTTAAVLRKIQGAGGPQASRIEDISILAGKRWVVSCYVLVPSQGLGNSVPKPVITLRPDDGLSYSLIKQTSLSPPAAYDSWFRIFAVMDLSTSTSVLTDIQLNWPASTSEGDVLYYVDGIQIEESIDDFPTEFRTTSAPTPPTNSTFSVTHKPHSAP